MKLIPQVPPSLAEQLTGVPGELRSAFLELHAVACGIKPVMRVTARPHRTSILMSWLSSRGFLCLLRRQDVDAATFAQASPELRAISDRVLWQIFIARKGDAMEAIARALVSQTSYFDIGIALGYPDCCAKWAASVDHVRASGDTTRQTNLVAAAVLHSTRFAVECNCLLRDSAIAEVPCAAISHYPCRFDCPATIEQARLYVSHFEELAPGASAFLMELLSRPHFWWSDVGWPVAFASETPGMMFCELPRSETGSSEFLSLSGNCCTPGGAIPERGRLIQASDTSMTIESDGVLARIDLRTAGRPHALIWA